MVKARTSYKSQRTNNYVGNVQFANIKRSYERKEDDGLSPFQIYRSKIKRSELLNRLVYKNKKS